jgi:hypothetical protein
MGPATLSGPPERAASFSPGIRGANKRDARGKEVTSDVVSSSWHYLQVA